MSRLKVQMLLLLVITSGCCGAPAARAKRDHLLLPPEPREARLKGPPPRAARVETAPGIIEDSVLVDPDDLSELFRELRQLRAWRDAVRFLLGKPPKKSEEIPDPKPLGSAI